MMRILVFGFRDLLVARLYLGDQSAKHTVLFCLSREFARLIFVRSRLYRDQG